MSVCVWIIKKQYSWTAMKEIKLCKNVGGTLQSLESSRLVIPNKNVGFFACIFIGDFIYLIKVDDLQKAAIKMKRTSYF